MLQFQVTNDFGNPNLPISNSRSALYLESALGVWEMNDAKDRSGNGHTLSVSGLTFDSTGLVCDGQYDHYADTGIIEPETSTVLMAFRADIPTATSQLYSSLAEGTTPYTGSRCAIQVSGAMVTDVGLAAGGTGRVTTGVIAPAWEMVAIVTDTDKLSVIRKSTGGKITNDFVGRAERKNTIRLGGGYVAPHNLGITGRIGLWAIYSGVLADEVISTLMTKAQVIMAAKGVTLP